MAGVVLQRLGVQHEQTTAALGVAPRPGDSDPSGEQLADIAYDQTGTAALRGALKAALRLRHNYIGTEHLLLGILHAGGPAAEALASLGLRTERVEQAIASVIERIVTQKADGPNPAGDEPPDGSTV